MRLVITITGKDLLDVDVVRLVMDAVLESRQWNDRERDKRFQFGQYNVTVESQDYDD